MKLLIENWRQYINEQNEIDAYKANLSSIIKRLLLNLNITSPRGQNGYNLKYFLDGNAEGEIVQYIELVKIMPELKPIYDEMIEPLLTLVNKLIEYFEIFARTYEEGGPSYYQDLHDLIKMIGGTPSLAAIDSKKVRRGTMASRLAAGVANPDIIPFLKRFRDMLDIQENPEDIQEQAILEKCWSGYEKKGMKKMFGKMYPNCVKKSKKKKKK